MKKMKGGRVRCLDDYFQNYNKINIVKNVFFAGVWYYFVFVIFVILEKYTLHIINANYLI